MKLSLIQVIELNRMAAKRCPIHVRLNPYCSICARLSEEIKAPLNDSPESSVTEAELQDAIAAECRRRGWICFRGSMAHRTHRTVGEPDLIVVTDKAVWFCECKRKGEKLRPEQVAIAAWLIKLGANHMAVYSLEQFLDLTKASHD